MKKLLFLLLSGFSYGAFGQPNPQEAYPARIKAITAKLKTDSLNYALIWERLEMKVNLTGGFPPTEELFSFSIDSNQINRKLLFYDEFNNDFVKIYNNVIQPKKFEIAEEGDFYLSRIWFYFSMLEPDKAIADAKYLRDHASYSRFQGRGDYYNDWALTSLFNLYVVKKDYGNALDIINSALKKQKGKNPKIFYSAHGSFLNYSHKVKLLEHFGKKAEMIGFLKQLCREHFEWYLKKARYKNADEQSRNLHPNEYYTSRDEYLYFMGNAKEKSFELLKLLIGYLQKYGSDELPKYEKIYNDIRYRMNENFETVNPGISDERLRSIVSHI